MSEAKHPGSASGSVAGHPRSEIADRPVAPSPSRKDARPPSRSALVTALCILGVLGSIAALLVATAVAASPATFLALPLNLGVSALQVLGLVSGTLISEDLTCITSGLLIRRGELLPIVALLGCLLGIWLGDLSLWALGHFAGRRLVAWGPIARRLPLGYLQTFGGWYDRSIPAAVVATRFLPGTRFPIYVAAGMFGRRAGAFALWSFIAALVWTPIVVLTVAVFGEVVVGPIESLLGKGWPAFLTTALILMAIARVIVLACTAEGRSRLVASVSRLWRREF